MKKQWHMRAKTALICLNLLLLGLLIVHSDDVLRGAREALVLCYRTVIPALFPFLVLSGLLAESGFADVCARVLTPLMKPLFSLDGTGAFSFVVGAVSGYPVGAKTIGDLYQSGKLSKQEAERLLPICNNAGPLFLIGAIGTGMLRSTKTGVFLYGIHIVSAILVRFCLRFAKKDIHVKGKDLTAKNGCQVYHHQGVSNIVSKAVQNMLLICGYILLFASLWQAVLPLLERFLPPFARLVIGALLEVTKGAVFVIQSGMPPREMLSLLSFFIGTGGFCVYLQVAGVLSGTGIKTNRYLFGKLLQGVFAGGLTYVLYPFFRPACQSVFANHIILQQERGDMASHLINLLALLAIVWILMKKEKGKKV